MPTRAFTFHKIRAYDTPKAAVTQLIEQRGGPKNVMVLLDYKSLTPIYAWTDDDSEKEMTVGQAAALTVPGAPSMAEYFAHRAGGVFLPIPSNGEPIASLTADAMRASGAAAAELVAALEGGLTPDEAEAALPELDQALRALAQLRASVKARAGEGGK